LIRTEDRIRSLWYLLKFHADLLIDRMLCLASVQLTMNWKDPKEQEGVIDDLARIRSHCVAVELPECAERAKRVIDYAKENFDQPSAISALANDLLADIQSSLEKREFLFIRQDRSGFADNPKLLGDELPTEFGDAIVDVQDAGNCLAAECNTAAVFHLMRVTEYGLRRISKQLRVKLTHSGKNHPLEFADWEKVITGIKNKITKLRTLSPGPKKQSRLGLYSDAADHCVFMKDIWRNNISHARRPYTRTEAMVVFERVKGFMGFLASSVSQLR
jgi:hypothetical protein